MENLKEFVEKTMKEKDKEIHEFKEFEKILRQLPQRRKSIYVSYITSST